MSNKKPIGGRQDIRDRLFSPVTDPKARVVDTFPGDNEPENRRIVRTVTMAVLSEVQCRLDKDAGNDIDPPEEIDFEPITPWEWNEITEKVADRVIDRLDSAGLLASAPVVPSEQELEAILTAHEHDISQDHWHVIRGLEDRDFENVAQAIRNHLLTIGWREK